MASGSLNKFFYNFSGITSYHNISRNIFNNNGPCCNNTIITYSYISKDYRTNTYKNIFSYNT